MSRKEHKTETGSMHILFLSHYFPPEVNAPATRTHAHCKRWVEAGHRVTVITCAPNCPSGVVYDGYKNKLIQKETVDGIQVVRLWTFLAANKGFVKRILNYLSYMLIATMYAITRRKVDVIVATSPQFFCGWAGVLCRWVRRWPFVLEIRDIWPESILTVGAMKRSLSIRVLEKLELWMYRTAQQIVTVGNGYRDKLLERGVENERISVIPNGVCLEQFRKMEASSASLKEWDSEDRFVCSYIGTVGMAHGLDVVVKAAATLQSLNDDTVCFWIVGDGAQRAKLEEEATQQKLSNIRFTGMIAKEQISDIIASSDACLVHLKGTDLFGTVIPSKIFEIMALNKPIIAGVRGQTEEIVLAGKAGVSMTPDDPESLLASIREIKSSSEQYQHGREYVAQHFNRDTLANEMLAVLKAVSENRPPTSIQPSVPAENSDDKIKTSRAA